jgi:hypothetical protein
MMDADITCTGNRPAGPPTCAARGPVPETIEEASVQPDPSALLARLRLTTPIIGLYDAPDPRAFAPLVEPRGRACVFAFRSRWLKGETLHLTRERYGCGGCARQFFDVQTRSRKAFIDFLVGDEGLRASPALMEAWIDASHPLPHEHEHVLLGPLRADAYEHLLTATLFVNPDQLSLLCQAAAYHSRPADPPPVIAPFSSGCGQLGPAFADLDAPQAMIGSTDLAMREYLEPDSLAFTATRSMFERLCATADDAASFFHKGFLRDLEKARGLAVE